MANLKGLVGSDGMGNWAAGLEKAADANKFEPEHLNKTATLVREVLGLLNAAPVGDARKP